ncbi:restriction endonuclease subunit M [Micromonospora aurantiaca (nom. illeg.)]|uniref:restriction endonuclease subunit M n=1 Tax=Micromonospora aurantiaca (nom. illeg.) TaxID=47850 RepID=UPI0033F78FB7
MPAPSASVRGDMVYPRSGREADLQERIAELSAATLGVDPPAPHGGTAAPLDRLPLPKRPTGAGGGKSLTVSVVAAQRATPTIGRFLERALDEGLAVLEANRRRIRYVTLDHTEKFDDPEEQVRADFWAELIYRYGYDAAAIGIEVTVPDRLPRDRADLVIFHNSERKRPYAVIECKREAIRDVEFDQAVEQAVGNGSWSKLRAEYVGVVAGLTRRFLDVSERHGILEREANIVADLPSRYGRPLEYKYYKGEQLDLRPVSRDELITTLSKCHQTLWGGGRLSPPAAFGELCKLIFVKIHDESALRAVGKPYQFQLRTHETSRELGDRIRKLYEAQQSKDPEVFSDPIRVDDVALRTLVSHLEPLNLSATELDVKGVAFEQFMDGFFKGDFGQYFTPREVIRLAVDMLRPTKDDVIVDPACGSGGFLLYALDYVRSGIKHYTSNEVEFFQHWSQFAREHLYGIEINEELTRVAKMNLIIHGDGHSNIINEDALESLEKLRRRHKGFVADGFDIVLTNPPFGATVSSATHPDMDKFALGLQPNGRVRKTQKTEILFIERVWQLLKSGTGRAAIVLPDGVLANSSTTYVRQFIFERFQVLAVVSLPATAFSHYGAAVKSSVVVLRKRSANETPDPDETTFMAAPDLIGYDATGRETPNQLPEVVQKYHEFEKNPQPFLV